MTKEDFLIEIKKEFNYRPRKNEEATILEDYFRRCFRQKPPTDFYKPGLKWPDEWLSRRRDYLRRLK